MFWILKIFFLILCILPSLSRSQDNLTIDATDSLDLIDYFLEFEKSEKINKEWVESLTEKGVSSDDKEIFFSLLTNHEHGGIFDEKYAPDVKHDAPEYD